MSSKKTIAIDLDDVLAVNIPAFIGFSNEKWGMNLTIEDYEEDWMKTWQVDMDGLAERARIIEKEFWHTLEHSEEAVPVLNELAKKYKLVVATSRRRAVSEVTRHWIDKYFAGIFEEIHHAGIFDVDDASEYTEASKKTKARLCQEIGADYLIDDHPKHCIGASAVGVKAILFGDYPWNSDVKLPPGIVRVKNWQEIGSYFSG
jgi:5'(3')-deoxyribonucleotidase